MRYLVPRTQVWREMAMLGNELRTARAWHRNRMLCQQETCLERRGEGMTMTRRERRSDVVDTVLYVKNSALARNRWQLLRELGNEKAQDGKFKRNESPPTQAGFVSDKVFIVL